jgi:lipid-binding SYLF domain-containing protein
MWGRDLAQDRREASLERLPMDYSKADCAAGIGRRRLLAAALAAAGLAGFSGAARADSAAEINKNVDAALKLLGSKNPQVGKLIREAPATLVFPKIIKAGLMVGGQYGEGAMRSAGKTVGYYSIAAASFGLQAGGQTYSYALIFMKKSAVDYLNNSDGWAVGSGPSVVVMDEGTAKTMTSTTITQDVVAVPFGQQGVMAGLGLEGSKITRIKKG